MKKLLLGALAALATLLVAPAAFASNCSPLPYTLSNGTTADANQVMADLNLLLSCSNTNLAHSGANTDITSLSSLSTPLSISQGGTGAATLAGLITNADLAAMANNTVKGNVSGGSATPSDLTGSQIEPLVQPYLPFELYAFVGGVTGDAWTLAAYQPSTGLVLTTAKSACTSGVAATGTTTYTLKDNGSSIGTAVVTGGGTSCAATITSSPYTVTAGHKLTITGPATGDATLADVGMTFGGTRQ